MYITFPAPPSERLPLVAGFPVPPVVGRLPSIGKIFTIRNIGYYVKLPRPCVAP